MVTPDTEKDRAFTFREEWGKVSTNKPWKGKPMEHEIKFDEDISMYKQAELLNGGKVDEDHMGRYIARMIALMDGFICEATEGLGFDEFRRANIFEAAGRAISDLGLARLFANNWDENNRPGGEEIMRAGKVREIGNAILGMEE